MIILWIGSFWNTFATDNLWISSSIEYEKNIIRDGRNIIEKKAKDQKKVIKDEKDFLSNAINSKDFNPVKNKEDKILYEYDRILNTSRIPKDAPVTTEWNSSTDSDYLTKNSLNSFITPITPLAAVAVSYYNRTNAVNYAYKWVYKRNNSYNFYAWLNDCTNFTSQVLSAGGMPYVINGLLWKYDTKNWYYSNTSNAEPSRTWWGANNFYKHGVNTSSKYSLASSFGNLNVWDILQADWDKNWSIDHSMVVTKKTWTSTSQIFLTYHNSYDITADDRKDERLSDILSSYPTTGSSYYWWKVIY